MIFPGQPVDRAIEGIYMGLCSEIGNPVEDFLSSVFYVGVGLLEEAVEIHALADVPIIINIRLWPWRRR